MVVFLGEEDCVSSCLGQGCESSESQLYPNLFFSSHAILVSQGNGCFPSGSKEGGVMHQPVVLFVFWIYFCINEKVQSIY